MAVTMLVNLSSPVLGFKKAEPVITSDLRALARLLDRTCLGKVESLPPHIREQGEDSNNLYIAPTSSYLYEITEKQAAGKFLGLFPRYRQVALVSFLVQTSPIGDIADVEVKMSQTLGPEWPALADELLVMAGRWKALADCPPPTHVSI